MLWVNLEKKSLEGVRPMRYSKYKHIYLLLSLVALLSFILVYKYMTVYPQGMKKPEETVGIPPAVKTVQPHMQVYLREIYTLCQKYQLSCNQETIIQGRAREELNNMGERDLRDKFPVEAGWRVDWQGQRIYLERINPGLCPEHKERWHLGLDEREERVAIYLGPSVIGEDGGLVQLTDLKVANFSPELKEKIKAGTMEFYDWEELIATLDSLDEYNEH